MFSAWGAPIVLSNHRGEAASIFYTQKRTILFLFISYWGRRGGLRWQKKKNRAFNKAKLPKRQIVAGKKNHYF